jgi:hypothetical protein
MRALTGEDAPSRDVDGRPVRRALGHRRCVLAFSVTASTRPDARRPAGRANPLTGVVQERAQGAPPPGDYESWDHYMADVEADARQEAAWRHDDDARGSARR